MSASDIVALDDNDEPRVRRIERPDGPVLGAWYWVKSMPDDKGQYHGVDDEWHPNSEKPKWLGCAMKIGSNYVEIRSPHDSVQRVHFDEFFTRLEFEPNARDYLQGKVKELAYQADGIMGEIKAVTARIGMTPQAKIGGVSQTSTALAVLGQQTDVHAYKNALVLAKEKELPALFERLKDTQEQMVTWMKAEVLPMKAELTVSKEQIEGIDDRIFSISLYAGLTEQAIKCCDGEPAEMLDKLHVMQRKLFMDEECLLNYKRGGMEFGNIEDFDAWISEPENRDRILPFPRTMVAMQVRRYAKHRDWSGGLIKLMQKYEDEQADKFTFIYIRNGEQVWRIVCQLEFDDLVFPDATVFNPDEPKMFKTEFSDRVRWMSVRDYEDKMERSKKAEAERKIKYEAWLAEYQAAKAASGEEANSWFDCPWEIRPDRDWSEKRDMEGWELFDHASVHYDEGAKHLDKQIKKYNRIALIIQGLFDRSPVLHPHLPVKSWTQSGFDQAITLVNDATMALTYGEPPDFEAYRAQLSRSIRVGSVTLGQSQYWMRKEAEKENKRRDGDWRLRSDEKNHVELWKPYGDPGPGEGTPVAYYNKGQCVFRWRRERRHEKYGESAYIDCKIQVPASALFNVDAYQPGDYKRFFQDPRTRAQYLEWAPFMLIAEEIKSGRDVRVGAELSLSYGSETARYFIKTEDDQPKYRARR